MAEAESGERSTPPCRTTGWVRTVVAVPDPPSSDPVMMGGGARFGGGVAPVPLPRSSKERKKGNKKKEVKSKKNDSKKEGKCDQVDRCILFVRFLQRALAGAKDATEQGCIGSV